jgi:L-ascorbate metabolism protein UlaG (beta-lactamase superfamily)
MKRRNFLSLLLGSTMAAMIASPVKASEAKQSRYYKGPVSDHFDGKNFFNPWEEGEVKGFLDVLRWKLNSKRAVWPETFPIKSFDTPPAKVDDDTYRVSYVGHASFLVQIAGMNILCDPVWSERASPFSFLGPKRVNPPGIKFEDLPKIDLVLISHNHYDHLDIETLKKLHDKFAPRIVTSLGNGTIIKAEIPNANVTVHDWYDHVDVGLTRIHIEPCHHWSARGTSDRREALWSAFVIEAASKKIYVIGDTGLGGGHAFNITAKRHKQFDLALIPIGAYEPRWFMSRYHINPSEAVQIKKIVNAKRAIGHHWGTFQLTDEAITKPVDDLKLALNEHKKSSEDFLALRPGEFYS